VGEREGFVKGLAAGEGYDDKPSQKYARDGQQPIAAKGELDQKLYRGGECLKLDGLQLHTLPRSGDERRCHMSDKQHDFGSLVCIYAQLLPRIRAKGKELGYAIAIHGTMERDLDLVAVPWTESASDPQELLKALADMLGGYVIGDRVEEKGYVSEHPTEQPHGRLSWNICWGGRAFIDLSIMPRRIHASDST
jgi:hypothetical protein